MLRFKDMFPMGIEYRPGEDELTNYRALRRKRTIGVGEGGPIGEQTSKLDQYVQAGQHAKGVDVGYGYKHKKLKNKQVVHQYTSEESEVDEALSVAARLKKGRDFKRNRAKVALGRSRAARKFADKKTLEKRARRSAYKAVYQKLTKNVSKDDLSPQRKAEIEKRLNSPAFKNRIARMSKKMIKDVRKKEMERKRG